MKRLIATAVLALAAVSCGSDAKSTPPTTAAGRQGVNATSTAPMNVATTTTEPPDSTTAQPGKGGTGSDVPSTTTTESGPSTTRESGQGG
jgi:hypothetical protein